jgi:hypothetical protein
MKIKYEMNGYQIVTKCPDKYNKAKVSSFSCHDCNYFISDDEKKQIVECNFKKKQEL